jgi:hypothetical protein
MRDGHKKVLIRLLVCYLIAAGVQTLVVAVNAGVPHGGAGPLVFAVFIFPVVPIMTAVQLSNPAGLDATQMRSIAYFAVTFLICCVVAFRRELRRWN